MTSLALANSKYLQGRLLALIDPTREANRIFIARCARLEVRSLSTRLRTVFVRCGRSRASATRAKGKRLLARPNSCPSTARLCARFGFSDNSHRTVLVYGLLRCLRRPRHSSIDVHSVASWPVPSSGHNRAVVR
jgi:hypothetical protein